MTGSRRLLTSAGWTITGAALVISAISVASGAGAPHSRASAWSAITIRTT